MNETVEGKLSVFTSVEQFTDYQKTYESLSQYRRCRAYAVGIARFDDEGQILDVYYEYPNHESNYGTAVVLADFLTHLHGTKHYVVKNLQALRDFVNAKFAPFFDDGKEHPNIDVLQNVIEVVADRQDVRLVVTFIDDIQNDPGPQSIPDVFLRLHLLSHRLVQPNEIGLEGAFGVLRNLAWTNEGPIALNELPVRRKLSMAYGMPIHVYSVDKFPQMTNYVVPPGVRIADGARVRLGAYLGEGTTVMHEGFVNFNAGTLGASMIEGRISAGVVIGDQSDLGGGCSTMGTLSGGGTEKISVGRGTLIGANAGIGISLGDLCVVEAGLYVTAGTKVLYKGEEHKAIDYSGENGLTFRRNSLTGAVEVLEIPNKIELNEELHAHN